MPAVRSQGSKVPPPKKEAGDSEQNARAMVAANGQTMSKRKSIGMRAAEVTNNVVGLVDAENGRKMRDRPSKRSKGLGHGEPTSVSERRSRTVDMTTADNSRSDQAKLFLEDASGQKAKRRVRNLEKGASGQKTEMSTELQGKRVRIRKKTVNGTHLNGPDVTKAHERSSETIPSRTPKRVKALKDTSGRSTVKVLLVSPPHDMNAGKTEGDVSRRRRRRRRRRKEKAQANEDDKLRIKKRVKNMVSRIRLEQNLIDAYAGEGWKGNSREKIRPEKELQRAEKQILHSKLVIREMMQELDNLGTEGSIQESAFDADGQISHEEIFCAKCSSQEALPDNDIILCDGFCDRGFHQLCLEPPLATADIPPGDEGWLCPVCESKAECLSLINGYLGTDFQVEDRWEEIFSAEAAAAAGGSSAAGEEDFPSEDSEDDDYDPDNKGVARDINDNDKEGDSSELLSLAEATSESEATSGSGESSDEDSGASLVNEDLGNQNERHSTRSSRRRKTEPGSEDERDHPLRLQSEDEDDMPVPGKRQRKPVDYKKLHDEMFGILEVGDDPPSEDEEWGPGSRRRKEKAEAGGNLENHSPSVPKSAPKNRSQKKFVNGGADEERMMYRRLPDSAVEVLRKEFAGGNCFPKKSYKENLAQELGIRYKQVCSWFKNARHAASKQGTVSPRCADLPGVGKTLVVHSNGGLVGRVAGAEELEAANGVLVEKLDEVQMKLHLLRETLEVLKSVRSPDIVNIADGGFIDTGSLAMMHSNRKRILYMPVAEVVEKVAEDIPRKY